MTNSYPVSMPASTQYSSHGAYLKALIAYILAANIEKCYIGGCERIITFALQDGAKPAIALIETAQQPEQEQIVSYTTDVEVAYDFIQAEHTKQISPINTDAAIEIVFMIRDAAIEHAYKSLPNAGKIVNDIMFTMCGIPWKTLCQYQHVQPEHIEKWHKILPDCKPSTETSHALRCFFASHGLDQFPDFEIYYATLADLFNQAEYMQQNGGKEQC